MTVPGIGPLIATAIAVLAPTPETFRKARDFAAWLGLVPRQHSTGGKQRLGATTKMGERSLRRLLIIGANSVIIKRHVHAAARAGTWLGGMLTRKPPMLVRVALANKLARTIWAFAIGVEPCMDGSRMTRGSMIFGCWSGAAMYSASGLRCARAP
jgi:transposase